MDVRFRRRRFRRLLAESYVRGCALALLLVLVPPFLTSSGGASLVSGLAARRRAIYRLRHELLLHGAADALGKELFARISAQEKRLRLLQARGLLLAELRQLLILHRGASVTKVEMSERVLPIAYLQDAPAAIFALRFRVRVAQPDGTGQEVRGRAQCVWNFARLENVLRGVVIDPRNLILPDRALSPHEKSKWLPI